jgi:hypothetical protein
VPPAGIDETARLVEGFLDEPFDAEARERPRQ